MNFHSALTTPALALLLFFTTAASADPARHRQYVERVETCEAILREFMARPSHAIPAAILQEARGIIIVNQFQGGFFLGGSSGYGVVLVRHGDQWSVPGFLEASGASLGFQFGGRSINTVYLLMDEAGARMLSSTRFSAGADARAIAGPLGAAREVGRELLENVSVIAYSTSKGLFAGATVKSGWLTPDDEGNRFFYRTQHTLPEILFGNWIPAPAEARPLVEFVQQITAR